jgi:hypothetical protein
VPAHERCGEALGGCPPVGLFRAKSASWRVAVLFLVVIVFAIAIGGSMVLGRWLQRKGRDMERHRD